MKEMICITLAIFIYISFLIVCSMVGFFIGKGLFKLYNYIIIRWKMSKYDFFEDEGECSTDDEDSL